MDPEMDPEMDPCVIYPYVFNYLCPLWAAQLAVGGADDTGQGVRTAFAGTNYLVGRTLLYFTKYKENQMATKTETKPSQEAKAKAKFVAVLAAIGEHLSPLAEPLFRLCIAKGRAAKVEGSWNAEVLSLVSWALTEGVPMGAIYTVMEETLATAVSRLGVDEGLGAEELVALRLLADNRISQMNGPLYCVSIVSKEESAASILTVANSDEATWSKVKGFVSGRVEALAFDPSRGSKKCHYTPKGTDHAVSFTVAQATETRDQHAAAIEKADAIKAKNSRTWSAVKRQFRAENPAGMVDGRTQQDRDQAALTLGRKVMATFSNEEIAKIG